MSVVISAMKNILNSLFVSLTLLTLRIMFVECNLDIDPNIYQTIFFHTADTFIIL